MNLDLNNATFTQICAFGILSETLNKAIDIYKAELDKERRAFATSMIYCWPDSGLCIRMNNGKSAVVGPEKATSFDRRIDMTFTNGQGKKAVWMTLDRALQINLNRAEQALADVYASIKA